MVLLLLLFHFQKLLMLNITNQSILFVKLLMVILQVIESLI
nr:MAG TPA: hypothetical protein [Caudoviricetes sp.]